MTLPRSAREHLDKLNLPAEIRAIAERIYPDDAKDREAAARKEAERQAELRQIQENRIELCKRARDGEFGKDAEGAAKQALAESGGEFTTMTVNRIVLAVKHAQRSRVTDTRQTRKHG